MQKSPQGMRKVTGPISSPMNLNLETSWSSCTQDRSTQQHVMVPSGEVFLIRWPVWSYAHVVIWPLLLVWVSLLRHDQVLC